MPSLVTPESNANQLYNALVMPVVTKWLGDRGYVMGDFDGGRNIVDTLRDQVFQRELNEAMHGAAQADRPAEERLLKGFATLGGVTWTPELAKLSKSVSGQLATIAPYIQAAAPDVWDELHGSQGSVANLTSAIATSSRHFVSPIDANRVATGVFNNLYTNGDHLSTRGFSAREMGQIYSELVKRGKISPNGSASQISASLTKHVGPISAIRDSMMGQTRGQSRIEDVFSAYDAMPHDQFRDSADMESKIRMGVALGHGGGLFSTAMRAEGGLPDGVDLQELEQKDQQLRQSAQASPIGNLVGATNRLSEEYGFPASSDAAKMLQQIQQGDVPFNSYGQWHQAMATAGIPEAIIRRVVATPARNVEFMTPELQNSVRGGQAREMSAYTNKWLAGMQLSPQDTEKMRPAVEEDLAARTGYSSADAMRALHGPAQQRASGFLSQAREEGNIRTQLSGIGTSNFTQRMSDAVQNATPATSIKDLMGSAFNVVPQSKVPKLPKMGGVPSCREDCAHCGASMEKSEDGYCNSCGREYDTGKVPALGLYHEGKTAEALLLLIETESA